LIFRLFDRQSDYTATSPERKMLYELIRAIVQKILQDKILLGLVIVAFLGIFVGGMTMGDEKDQKPTGAKVAQGSGEQPLPGQAPGQGATQQASAQQPAGQQAGSKLTPQLACDFVSYWLQSAMDYNAQTAQQSHNQAMAWMTPDAAATFQAQFWTPQIAEAVTTGRLISAFQPTGVQAQAVNPDGSVVIGVAGTMIVQSGGQPVPQQFLASFLVKQDNGGSLRIAGLQARTGAGTY
jgi:hypothetical protein